MPEVPTSAEAGLPDLSRRLVRDGRTAQLKPELQDQIAKATIEVLKMPDVQQRFRTLNVEPDGERRPKRPPSSGTKPGAGAR